MAVLTGMLGAATFVLVVELFEPLPLFAAEEVEAALPP
jgi:hypothetical protein